MSQLLIFVVHNFFKNQVSLYSIDCVLFLPSLYPLVQAWSSLHLGSCQALSVRRCSGSPSHSCYWFSAFPLPITYKIGKILYTTYKLYGAKQLIYQLIYFCNWKENVVTGYMQEVCILKFVYPPTPMETVRIKNGY